MSEKVLIVTAGVYSDYHIVAAFTEAHRVNATMVADSVAGRLEEHVLNPRLPEKLCAGLNYYRIHIARDGKIYDPCRWAWELGGHPTRWTTRSDNEAGGHGGIVDVMEVYVWARNRHHAAKIANERRAHHCASEWPDDAPK